MRLEDAARILARPGQLSSVEREQILSRIEATRTPWLQRHRGALAGVAAALTACVVIVLVSRPGETLTARGEAEPAFAVRCAGRAAGDCVHGDRLSFDFGPTPPAAYVAILARDAAGNVTWFVPDEGQASTLLHSHVSDGVLDRVAVIDETYHPGTYTVFAITSPRPLTREEIRGFARGSADNDRLVAPDDVHIAVRSFVVREEP